MWRAIVDLARGRAGGAEWVGMDDQLLQELTTLRARAYGPGSDIHDDPAALNRLQDLEELARGAASPAKSVPAEQVLPPKPPLPAVATPLPDASPAPLAQPALPTQPALPEQPTPLPQPTPSPADSVSATEGARRTPWTKKRLALTWLASLGVGILVTATVTGFVSRRIQADPREIAVLGADAFGEWPGIFSSYTDNGEREEGVPDGGMAFASFHGLSAFRMPDGIYSYGSDQTCLMVLPTEKIDQESNSFDGPIFNGCSAGIFPATVEIVVAPDSSGQLPDELVDAFPEGTALQFVLDGDEVVVLSDQD